MSSAPTSLGQLARSKKSDQLTGATRATPGDSSDFYGSAQVRLPQYTLVAVGTVLIGLIPFPHADRHETVVAGILFFSLISAAFLLPWERLPDWAWLIVPIGYMAVIAIIRDAQGGSDSGLVIVYLLPIVWLALYGRRSHLFVGLFFMDLALLAPVIVVGRPKYPPSDWRQVVVMAVVTTLVSYTVSTMVSRDRAFVGDLAQQSRLARRSAAEAESAKNRLETLLRAATGSAIMGVDPAGTITFFSAGAELMLGYSAAEVVGTRSIADFIDPAQIDERRQAIDSIRSATSSADPEKVAEVPWTATRQDGQQRRCVVRVRALPGGGGAGAGYVVVAIDVTEREDLASERERLYAIQKEVTQSLVEQNNRLRELTQMKDDVVATVSHELRTPITSIRGFVELLLDGVDTFTPDQIRMLRTIDRNSGQLQRVAEDLLSDPGAGHGLRVTFSELDLRQLADEAVEGAQTTATTAGVTVMLASGSTIPVFGDANRLHQLLGNLLSNAIKFSPYGGKVEVKVDLIDTFACLQVRDQGPGIPAADREQLFERFYRLAAATEMGIPGTGLGLAIAKSVAEAHDGFIDIVDTPEWSTTFRVFLPVGTPAVARS
jgi:PAS domain S-box-containing protein